MKQLISDFEGLVSFAVVTAGSIALGVLLLIAFFRVMSGVWNERPGRAIVGSIFIILVAAFSIGAMPGLFMSAVEYGQTSLGGGRGATPTLPGAPAEATAGE